MPNKHIVRPKLHRQTLRSKAKIPLIWCLRASLPPHPAGEDVVDNRGQKNKKVKSVNISVRTE